MQKSWVLLTIITLGAAWMSASIPAIADDDDYGREYGEYERGEHERSEHSHGSHSHGIVVRNVLYKTECGSCHLAYQPVFLPASSWRKIMATLDEHFGENAELPVKTSKELLQHLTANASDIGSGRAVSDAPLRISEQRHFRREHGEVPARMVKNNPKVRSFSNCQACHVGAENGDFSERHINIPGFGRWED